MNVGREDGGDYIHVGWGSGLGRRGDMLLRMGRFVFLVLSSFSFSVGTGFAFGEYGGLMDTGDWYHGEGNKENYD